MSGYSHSRESSNHSTSSSSNASSYQLILDHVFSCPSTYELPLRTIFAHNSNQHLTSPSPSVPISPIEPPDAQQQAAAEFTTSLMSHMSQLPSQPGSLPSSFICTFLRKCFPPNLLLVDFPQALTGLDYLKDLENKRKKEIHGAFERLGIDRASLKDDFKMAQLKRRHPHVVKWMDEIEVQERKVEALYTGLFVGIRRWVCYLVHPRRPLRSPAPANRALQIIVNELMIQPFNANNCYAMLNTLYPPRHCTPGAAQLTSKLTPAVLDAQRTGFFKWIKTIQKYQDDPRGPVHHLRPLMQQGVRANSTDENGWPAVRENLDKYLRLAQHQADECVDIITQEDIDSHGHKRQLSSAEWDKRKKQRKADSGVSFGSDRPSTSGSGGQPDVNKALPMSPPHVKKQATTLERLTRELRRIKGSRAGGSVNASFDSALGTRSHSRADSHASNGSGRSVGESSILSRAPSMYNEPRGRLDEHSSPASGTGMGRSLRKLRSFGDMRAGRSMSPFRKVAAPPTPSDEAFDEAEMRRQRELWEAGAGRKATRH